MTVGRLRILVTVTATVVALFTVLVLGRIAVGLGNDAIDERVMRDAEDTVKQAFLLEKAGKDLKDARVWIMGREGEPRPSFETNLQPPFRLLYRPGQDFVSTDAFAVGGRTYLAYVQPVNADSAYGTIVDLDEPRDDKRALFQQVALLGVVFTALAGAAAWLVAGRLLRPARQALDERRGFLADAAHEMRTPLAVILASASQALARSREPAEYVRSLSEIRSAAERASAGVNELLDLARLETGQAIPRLAPLRLDLLAEEVAAAVRTDDCVVEADPAEPVVVDADMALLRQAVDNVVRNATRRSTKVVMTTVVDGRDGVLRVDDDGPGFDPAVLPHVFARYRRGDRNGQVGLGLSLVQAILAAHGGEARAANRPDGGARLELRVPLSR